MKLVIHCGLHKTGTTSFQAFCRDNQSALFDVGIHYPRFNKHNDHNCVIHGFQADGIGKIQDYFNHAYAEAAGVCHTVLLSGEDFENCIVDVALAADIESAAHEAGFESVTWVVVTRERDELLRSLYAEMSKHGVILRLDHLALWALKRGCLYVSANNYNYIFVIDYPRFETRFITHTSGQHITLRFEDFVRSSIGMPLFEKILPEDNCIAFRAAANFNTAKKNTRLSAYQAEVNYLATALGADRLKKRPYSLLLAPLILFRRRQKGST